MRAYHDLCNKHPFLFLRVFPPYAFRTTAPITAGTITATNGSTTITFTSPPATSVATLEILIAGTQEAYRIASHTAAAATATLDVAFSGTSAAGLSYTIFQREYALPAATRHIESLIVPETGFEIRQREELELRRGYPDPPSAVWPPQYFARIGEQRIRFEGYPNVAKRIELAYTQIPDDPGLAGSVTILVPRNWRYVVVDGGLYWLYVVKNDTRADAAGILFAGGRDAMIEDDARKRLVLGKSVPRRGSYA